MNTIQARTIRRIVEIVTDAIGTIDAAMKADIPLDRMRMATAAGQLVWVRDMLTEAAITDVEVKP